MSNATGPNTTSIESRARYACMNGGNVSSITGKVVKLAREADAEIERLRARVEAADVEIADLHDRISDMRDDASKTEQTLRARVAEWEQKAANWIASPEATARLDGYRELAQRLNAADARVAELERDRVHAGVDICEVAAAVEVVRVMEIVKEVAGVVANLHEGPFRHGFEAACEEIEHRLRPCEHCDTALAKDGA